METSRQLISINTKRWKQGTDLFPPHHGGMGVDFIISCGIPVLNQLSLPSRKFGCGSVVPATTV
jgi:hypothetical protein